MEIKASSVYDKKTVAAFSKHSLKRFKPLCIFIYVLLSFLIVVNLHGIIALNNPISSLVFPIFMAAFFLLFVYVYLPKYNYKIQKTKSDAINEFIFYDTKIVANSNSQGITETMEIAYSTIFNVFENKAFIYIYIAKEKALIIDKSTITNGSIEEIRYAITSQISTNKYKIKF